MRTLRPTPLGDEPGTYRVAFGVLPEGSYRAAVVGAGDAGAETTFDVWRSTGAARLRSFP